MTGVAGVGMVIAMEVDRTSTVGEFVRRRREQLGLKQRQLADMIGREQTFISSLENNRNEGYLPQRDVVLALADALEVDEIDILRAAGYVREPEVTPAPDDDVRVYTLMQRQIDGLDIAPNLKAHMRSTIQLVRELAQKGEGA